MYVLHKKMFSTVALELEPCN